VSGGGELRAVEVGHRRGQVHEVRRQRASAIDVAATHRGQAQMPRRGKRATSSLSTTKRGQERERGEERQHDGVRRPAAPS